MMLKKLELYVQCSRWGYGRVDVIYHKVMNIEMIASRER
jgi:hypothetical protein